MMVCLERMESQDKEVHQDRVAQRETVDIKVYLVPLVLQDFLGQKDKVDLLVGLVLKVPKESLEWMAKLDQTGLPVLMGPKEIVVYQVNQAFQVWGIRGFLDP
ncbi:hypothetical protein EYF80_035754 [Liparis tanakae]|uniref:Uncharacterized protein n=1 Tax=Liparis tanakae TaxID=230148 RepID=A0A4Z2GMN8_9TELE|nr:hypothetical protein EYF80_035754 [Liparis tanakae]